MNKFLLLSAVLLMLLQGINFKVLANTDYATLYKNTNPADFELVHGIDPYQNEDYQKYAWSPFPLFRLSSDVYFKGQVIPAGYYILTPRTMYGKDYVFFKEAGKVKYIIPVVKKELVPVDFYHTQIPEPKYTKWQSFCKNVRDGFYTLFKNSSRKTPPPSSYVVTEIIEGDMYLIVVYYGESKYYLVFKAKKD